MHAVDTEENEEHLLQLAIVTQKRHTSGDFVKSLTTI